MQVVNSIGGGMDGVSDGDAFNEPSFDLFHLSTHTMSEEGEPLHSERAFDRRRTGEGVCVCVCVRVRVCVIACSSSSGELALTWAERWEIVYEMHRTVILRLAGAAVIILIGLVRLSS